MPVEFTEAIVASENSLRKRWTRAECEVAEALGLWEGQRLELVQGELIDKRMGKNPPHITAVILLQRWLVEVFGFDLVRKEDPINVAPEDNPTSEPEPDLAVLRRPAMEFQRANPGPADIALVVEVASSTLFFDLRQKAGLYARAGIPEYWVLDIALRRLFVHREPFDGKYHSVKIYSEQESVAPLVAPQSEFRVAQAFGD